MAYYMEPPKTTYYEEDYSIKKKNKNDKDEIFYVKSIKLANILMEEHGFKLLKVEQNPDNPRYQLFSFEKTDELQKVIDDYIKNVRDTMFDFGVGIHKIKAGEKVTRRGWAKKHVYVYLVPENKDKNNGEYIAIKTGTGTVMPFVASATDLLADDWVNYNE